MARQVKFQLDYYYHICNRGVDKRKVFLEKWDFVRFLESLREFNKIEATGGFYEMYLREKNDLSGGPTPKLGVGPPKPNHLVEILAYCLNPNHYHLLLQQLATGGISEFMKRIGVGYTGYFNHKYARSGSLFQGKYKVREIKSTFDLLKMSVYVNCNSEIHHIANKENWIWSSYLDYIGQRKGNLAKKKIVLQELKEENIYSYQEFCEELIPEIQKRKDELEDYNLE